MPSIENFLTYAFWQYDVIRHLFAFSTAVFLAGLVYFAMTARTTAPTYRLSAYISAVVMVSAALELGQLWLLWNQSFEWAVLRGSFVPVAGEQFSNGYRYMNWLIDVPMLATQLVVVCGFAGAELRNRWAKLTIAGVLMILTGYVGQYFEPAVAGIPGYEGAVQFWIWGIVSTAFYVWMLLILADAVRNPKGDPSDEVRARLKFCFWFLLATWSIYPLAYAMPLFSPTAEGVVVRQVIYTVADVSSKLVFGVILSQVALKRSANDG
ncbi:MAG: bacteriorhodopsin [Erythrobacter sp.]